MTSSSLPSSSPAKMRHRGWLGRDLFTVTELDRPTREAEHFVKLRRQYRMHPAVSAIPNELFYEGVLKDDQSASSDDELAG